MDEQRHLQVGDTMVLEIDTLANGGDGIGRWQGMAVFVPGTAVGDRVEVTVEAVQKRFARAYPTRVIEPGEMRREPPCTVYEQCGGCQWQHIDYEEQLLWKQRHVHDALVRIGGFDPEQLDVRPTIGMEEPWLYRNKAAFPIRGKVGDIEIGYYRQGTRRLVALKQCMIVHPLINHTLEKVRLLVNEQRLSSYDAETELGLLRHLVVRVGHSTGEVLVAVVINGDGWAGEREFAERLRGEVPEIVGVLKNIHKKPSGEILGVRSECLSGRDFLIDRLAGVHFAISIDSFYQVNPLQTETLYREAVAQARLSGRETVFDLYCGIGTITLMLAQQAKRVYGIEVVPKAVRDARHNAERNGVNNVEFLVGDVAQRLPQLMRVARPDVLVVDPPRRGIDKEVLSVITQSGPQRIVYVSCNPTTLARDLAILREAGYALQKVQPVDMFPQTAHVETVVLMSRL